MSVCGIARSYRSIRVTDGPVFWLVPILPGGRLRIGPARVGNFLPGLPDGNESMPLPCGNRSTEIAFGCVWRFVLRGSNHFGCDTVGTDRPAVHDVHPHGTRRSHVWQRCRLVPGRCGIASTAPHDERRARELRFDARDRSGNPIEWCSSYRFHDKANSPWENCRAVQPAHGFGSIGGRRVAVARESSRRTPSTHKTLTASQSNETGIAANRFGLP